MTTNRTVGKSLAFLTGAVPVSDEGTIEIFAFMEAAEESYRQSGNPAGLADVLAKAKA